MPYITFCATHSHNCLKSNLPCQITPKKKDRTFTYILLQNFNRPHSYYVKFSPQASTSTSARVLRHGRFGTGASARALRHKVCKKSSRDNETPGKPFPDSPQSFPRVEKRTSWIVQNERLLASFVRLLTQIRFQIFLLQQGSLTRESQDNT